MKTTRETIMAQVHFFWRQLPLFLLTMALTWLALTGQKFDCLGEWQFDEMRGGIWVPFTPILRFGGTLWSFMQTANAFYLWQVLTHFSCPNTIDADARTRKYEEDWSGLSPSQRVFSTVLFRAALLIAVAIIVSSTMKGAPIPVNQVARWDSAQVEGRYNISISLAVEKYRRTEYRYQKVQAMRKNGVPAPILFCLFYREADNDFRMSAAQGDPLSRRSVNVPKGRIPNKYPPYTWEEAAFDAYYVVEHPPLDRIEWANKQKALDKMESFNGYGYRAKGIAAPYLWSGTSIYHGGKYVRDGVFSRVAMDRQLGCAAILKGMQASGIKIAFL